MTKLRFGKPYVYKKQIYYGDLHFRHNDIKIRIRLKNELEWEFWRRFSLTLKLEPSKLIKILIHQHLEDKYKIYFDGLNKEKLLGLAHLHGYTNITSFLWRKVLTEIKKEFLKKLKGEKNGI